MKKITELKLGSSYETQVTIPTSGGTFFGSLKITPKKITLVVSGDEFEDRKWPYSEPENKELECHSTREHFKLIGLTMNNWSGMLLATHPKLISSIQITYSIECVAMSHKHQANRSNYHSITIHSDTIKKWIGQTEKQREIAASQITPPNYNGSISEFKVGLKNQDTIGISYSIEKSYSLPNFHAGMKFPPYIHYYSCEPLSLEDAINKIKKIYSFFSFITNKGMNINQIILNSGTHKTYLYTLLPEERKIDTILYPYSEPDKAQLLGKTRFLIDYIRNYFELEDKSQEYFYKYLKYSRMTNPEDSFLGYFRILENLCIIEKQHFSDETINEICAETKSSLLQKKISNKDAVSFIRGMKRLNKSKYNTEKCIQEFYKTLPSKTRNLWKFNKEKISEICKLRNDITHANDYSIDDSALIENLVFLDALLTVALLKEIGVEDESIHEVSRRIDHYYFIAF
jgi:hypothetical protein